MSKNVSIEVEAEIVQPIYLTVIVDDKDAAQRLFNLLDGFDGLKAIINNAHLATEPPGAWND